MMGISRPPAEPLSVPEAIEQLQILIETIQLWIDCTPFLVSTMHVNGQEQDMHPGNFCLGNLKKIEGELLLEYGREMWAHGRATAQRYLDQTAPKDTPE